MSMILIDALFINKGGGATLLEYLIETILAHPRKDSFFFLLDPRFAKPAALTQNYTVIPNKITERIRFYKQHQNDYTCVFCFANTPPPVKLKVPAYTYMHNQKLLAAPKHKFEKMFWGQYVKYLFIKLFNHNTDYYIVQTPHMVHELVGTGLKDNAHCLTIPFYDNRKYAGGGQSFDERPAEFVFISNPSPQKNYPTLLDAWEYLLELGHTPKLHVTIDDTAPAYIARVDALNKRGAQIVNHPYLDPRDLYFNCRYLIFPSIMESFGLPLIEATDSGMKVLAANLAYVYDVVKPSLTFEPYDKQSIADAVLRALSSELPFPEIVTKNEVGKLVELLIKTR
jgi:glycosyltransferase involved in cell wall biosynthesis